MSAVIGFTNIARKRLALRQSRCLAAFESEMTCLKRCLKLFGIHGSAPALVTVHDATALTAPSRPEVPARPPPCPQNRS